MSVPRRVRHGNGRSLPPGGDALIRRDELPIGLLGANVKFRSNESGQVLLIVALALPMLIGFVGLAVDVGNIEVGRRQAQSAADAAAIAGAQELFGGNGTTVAHTAAQDSATQNGFRNGVNSVTVTVNTPPLAGPNQGNANAVEVIIARTQPTFFMALVGAPTTTIGARAVGALSSSPICVQVTGPVGEGIDIDGGFILNAPTCSVAINSVNTAQNGNGEQSITTHGGNCNGGGGTSTASYTLPTGTSQMIVASVSTSAAYYQQGVCISKAASGPIVAPTFNMAPLPDLLAYLPQPSSSVYAACDRHSTQYKITASTTLNPGSYCGGIWITNNATVTLNAGTYYLYGGSAMGQGGPNMRHSLEVDGGSTLNGTGVTFFNTGATTPCVPSGPGVNCAATPPASDWAPILLCTGSGPQPNCTSSGPGGSKEATVNLSAPTSGTYSGILFFDARTLTDGTAPCGGTNAQHEQCAKPTQQMQTYVGGANQQFSGTFYFPTTQLNFTGGPNAGTGNCSPFVGWILLWNIPGPFSSNGSGGGLTINANCGGVVGGNPLKMPALGE